MFGDALSSVVKESPALNDRQKKAIAKAAINKKVTNLVLVSSDKAVRPTNIMGATKRFAELILQSQTEKNKTKMTMVRFGNVIGSSGSAIPKFTEQIKNGGPVTITHPEITRFFMTITEAAQLVIQSSSLAKGGEIFLLIRSQKKIP